MKKIYITGGNSGIGAALTRHYLKQGHQVAVCSRQNRPLEGITQEESARLTSDQVNVLDKEALKESMNKFTTQHGPLDLVIASAGVSQNKGNKKLDFNEVREVMDINFYGTLNTFEVAIPFLNQASSQLVSISSVAGRMGLPRVAGYSASKSALITLCESLSLDLASQNISCTCILPGFVDTPLTRKNRHAMPFLMTSDKAALKIARAIEKKVPRYTFPLPMAIIVGILTILPRSLYLRLMKPAAEKMGVTR